MNRLVFSYRNGRDNLSYSLVFDNNLSFPLYLFQSEFLIARLRSLYHIGFDSSLYISKTIYHALVLLLNLVISILVLIFLVCVLVKKSQILLWNCLWSLLLFYAYLSPRFSYAIAARPSCSIMLRWTSCLHFDLSLHRLFCLSKFTN